MKRICKELMKKNKEREKEILECNNEIYTDMIVYLRCSDITEYNQELVREDLINMIIDGQNRGDDIEKVMGGNYKEICDEIIESMPKTTKLEKFLSALQIGLSSVWILGLIAVIKELLFNIIMGNGDWNFVLSLGDIINFVLCVILAQVTIKYLKGTLLKKESKIKEFFTYWILGIIIVGIFVVISYFLDFTILSISIVMAAIIVAGLFILDKAASFIIDEKIL